MSQIKAWLSDRAIDFEYNDVGIIKLHAYGKDICITKHKEKLYVVTYGSITTECTSQKQVINNILIDEFFTAYKHV